VEKVEALRWAVLMYVSEHVAVRQRCIYKPAVANDQTFQMRVSADFVRRLDDWRREQPDLPSRAEAIRRLVEQALGPEKKSKR
jgi:hypothetical protein